MATLREMVYSIREQINAYSDDSKLSNEHLAFMIRMKRNMFLEQLAKSAKKEIPREAYQRITLTLSPCTDCEEDLVILKSNEYLPAMVYNMDEEEGFGLGRIHLESIMAKWINVTTAQRVPFLKEGRFNGNQVYIYRTKDDKLAIVNTENNHVFLQNVLLEVLAEDPESCYALVNNEYMRGNKVTFWDSLYPIPESLVTIIEQGVLQDLLGSKYRVNDDTANDGADSQIGDLQKVPYYGKGRGLNEGYAAQ